MSDKLQQTLLKSEPLIEIINGIAKETFNEFFVMEENYHNVGEGVSSEIPNLIFAGRDHCGAHHIGF